MDCINISHVVLPGCWGIWDNRRTSVCPTAITSQRSGRWPGVWLRRLTLHRRQAEARSGAAVRNSFFSLVASDASGTKEQWRELRGRCGGTDEAFRDHERDLARSSGPRFIHQPFHCWPRFFFFFFFNHLLGVRVISSFKKKLPSGVRPTHVWTWFLTAWKCIVTFPCAFIRRHAHSHWLGLELPLPASRKQKQRALLPPPGRSEELQGSFHRKKGTGWIWFQIYFNRWEFSQVSNRLIFAFVKASTPLITQLS